MAIEALAKTVPSVQAYPDVLSVWSKPDMCLRALAVTDAAELCAAVLANRERLEEFQSVKIGSINPLGVSLAIARRLEMVRRGEVVDYQLVKDEKIMGSIALQNIDRAGGTAELAGWIDREAEGGGYAYSASHRLVRFAFEELNLHTLRLEIDPRNVRSQRLASRLEAFLTGETSMKPSADGSLAAYRIWEIDRQ